jgi:hypothetical protein
MLYQEQLKQISDDPITLIQFARECVYEFTINKDANELVVARRVMLRASQFSSRTEYWIDRFAVQLQDLELAVIADAHLKDRHTECHETLDLLEAEVVAHM